MNPEQPSLSGYLLTLLPKRWMRVTAVVTVAILLAVLFVQHTRTESTPVPDVTGTREPGLVQPGGPPAPTTTPATTPTDAPLPVLERVRETLQPVPGVPTNVDSSVAAEQAQLAAQNAVSAVLFFDSQESRRDRETRLSAYFTDGAQAITAPSMFEAEPGYETVQDSEMSSVDVVTQTDTDATVMVAVVWQAARWSSAGGPTETIGGDMTFAVEVTYTNGSWLATTMTQNS